MRVIFTTAKEKNTKWRWSRFWKCVTFRKGMHRHNPALYAEFHLKRLVTTFFFLLILGYLSITAALAVFWGNRPHSPITYWDVFWPGNWDTIRPQQGQMLIAQADEAREAGKLREAFILYRNGLRMYPHDQEARLIFAKMLAGSGLLERAGKALAEGLQYGYPEDPEYLGVLSQIIGVQQNQELLTEIVPTLLREESIANDPEKKYPLLNQYMKAQLISKDYLGAIATAEQLNADPDAPAKAHEVIIGAYMSMGATDQALDYVAALPEEEREKPSIKLGEAGALGEAGRTQQMMRVLQSLYRQNPSDWQIQLAALQLMIRYATVAQADSYMELYISTHLKNIKALNALAVKLTDLPDSARLQRMINRVIQQRPELGPSYAFFMIQALLTEGKFKEADQLYGAWIKQVKEDSPKIALIKVFGSILEAATDGGSGARNELLKELRSTRFPPEVYWEAAYAMYQSGHTDTAISVLNAAANFYPAQTSLQQLRKHIMDPEQTPFDTLQSRTRGIGNSTASRSNEAGSYDAGITEQDVEDQP